MTDKKRQELFEECICELGRRVDLPWGVFDDVKDWIEENRSDDDYIPWYHLRTWTEQDEKDFREWMYKFLKKKTRWDKKQIDMEIGTFLLQYSWKYSD
jgi:hypothetical protein